MSATATIYYTDDDGYFASSTYDLSKVSHFKVKTPDNYLEEKRVKITFYYYNQSEKNDSWYKVNVKYAIPFLKQARDVGFISERDYAIHLECIRKYLLKYEEHQTGEEQEKNGQIESNFKGLPQPEDTNKILSEIDSLLEIPEI